MLDNKPHRNVYTHPLKVRKVDQGVQTNKEEILANVAESSTSYAKPVKEKPKVEEPEKEEPEEEEPEKEEPRKVEPKMVEPEKVEPKKVEPKKVEPKKVELKAEERIQEFKKQCPVEDFKSDLAMDPVAAVTSEVAPVRLIEFKAGRMTLVEKQVIPDQRHGIIYMFYDSRQQLHFCWRDREVKLPEVDIIIQAGIFEFRHIEFLRTGRIYVLKYRRSSTRMFFWMQDPRRDLDDKYCARVNELLDSDQPLPDI